jgi:hypothetical protein
LSSLIEDKPAETTPKRRKLEALIRYEHLTRRVSTITRGLELLNREDSALRGLFGLGQDGEQREKRQFFG